MTRTRRWTLAGAAGLGCLFVGVLVVRTLGSPESGLLRSKTPGSSEKESSTAQARPGSSGTSGRTKVPPPPQDLSPQGRIRSSKELAVQLQNSLLQEVRNILKGRGGAAALAFIRERLSRPVQDYRTGIEQACLARLIAFVAVEDPPALPAAISLTTDLLANPATDPWVRVQVLAGAGGLSSMNLILACLRDGPVTYLYTFDAGGLSPKGPYDSSLGGGARLLPSVLTALRSDPSSNARQAAVRVLAELGPPSASEALAQALSSDPSGDVRSASLEGLARLKSPDLLAWVEKSALQDDAVEVRSAAFRVLPKTTPPDPAAGAFLSRCLATGLAEADVHPALVAAAFDHAGRALQPDLSAFLIQHAGEEGVARVFAERAVAGEMTHFLPLFQTLTSSLPADSPARESLERASRQLLEAPRYAALARQIQEGSTAIRAMWDEFNRKGTAAPRRDEILAKISTMTFQLWEIEEALEK